MRRVLLAFLLALMARPADSQQALEYRISGGGSSGGTSIVFVGLGAQPNGSFYYCTDCGQVSPCAGGGAGAFAFKVAGTWTCASTGGASVDNTITDDNINVGNGAVSQNKALANGVLSYATATNTFSAVLGNVENTALSTWAGTANITTLGAITSPFLVGPAASTDQIRIVAGGPGANPFTGSLTGVDLTGNRTYVLPDADATLVQPQTCGGTDKVSAVSSAGVVTCSADGGGTGSFTSGAGDPPGTCTPPAFYQETDTQELYYCQVANSWEKVQNAPATAGGFVVSTTNNDSIARTVTSPNGSLVITNADGVAGNVGIDVDNTQYVQFGAGVADPPGTCTEGQQIYLETDTNELYGCVETNTWGLLGSTGGGYAEVQEEGAGLATRTVLNFAGDGVTCADDTTKTTCTIPGGGSTFDPSTTLFIYDDFCSGNFGTSGNGGAAGMLTTLLNTGVITNNATTNSNLNNPCLVRVDPSASDNSGGVIRFENLPTLNATYAGTDWSLDGLLIYDTTITNTSVWFGLANSAANLLTASSGIWIIRDTDAAHTAFVFQICDANSAAGCQAAGDDTDSTTAASTITPAGDGRYRLRIRRDGTGVGGNPTISMRVNDEAEVTFCSSGCTETLANMPTGDLVFVMAFVTRAASQTMYGFFDYMAITIPGLARY